MRSWKRLVIALLRAALQGACLKSQMSHDEIEGLLQHEEIRRASLRRKRAFLVLRRPLREAPANRRTKDSFGRERNRQILVQGQAPGPTTNRDANDRGIHRPVGAAYSKALPALHEIFRAVWPAPLEPGCRNSILDGSGKTPATAETPTLVYFRPTFGQGEIPCSTRDEFG
jgi:hypothetical protein